MTSPVILYVEDDPKSRTVVEIIVRKRMGFDDLIMFEDSIDFETRVQALDPPPALVLLDIHIQPLNGFEMLAYLRALPAFAETPVIALTASVMTNEIHELKSAGFNGCISKPLSLQTFPDLLQRALADDQVWHIQ